MARSVRRRPERGFKPAEVAPTAGSGRAATTDCEGRITAAVDAEQNSSMASSSDVSDDADRGDENRPSEAPPGDDVDGTGEANKVLDNPPSTKQHSPVRAAAAAGILIVLALSALTGWLGWRAEQSHRRIEARTLFLQVGRQGALNLTTIDFRTAETDVQRIIDASTGTFQDDFRSRSKAFIETVRQAQSVTQGSVGEAGIESVDGDRAQVLVAVTVKTQNVAAPTQKPRSWRMRITVQKVGDGAKVSNVEFVV
ncbi:Mce protein [Mycobacterium palustre]|nr:Mce protein [Mycobacterium palustre]